MQADLFFGPVPCPPTPLGCQGCQSPTGPRFRFTGDHQEKLGSRTPAGLCSLPSPHVRAKSPSSALTGTTPVLVLPVVRPCLQQDVLEFEYLGRVCERVGPEVPVFDVTQVVYLPPDASLPVVEQLFFLCAFTKFPRFLALPGALGRVLVGSPLCSPVMLMYSFLMVCAFGWLS